MKHSRGSRLVFTCISAAIVSLMLLFSYVSGNSDLAKTTTYDNHHFIAMKDSSNPGEATYDLPDSTSMLEIDISEEGFTGDAMPTLENANSLSNKT